MAEDYGRRIYRQQKSKGPYVVMAAAAAVIIAVLVISTLKRGPEAAPGGDRGEKITETVETPVPAQDVGPAGTVDSTEGQKPPEVSGPVKAESPGMPEQEAAEGAAAVKSIGQLTAEADAFLAAGKYRPALKLYKEILKQDRRVLTRLGRCYYGLADYDNAKVSLEWALEDDDRDFDACKYLALTLYRMDELAASLQQTERGLAIRKDPELLAFQNRLKRELAVMEEGYREKQIPQFKIIFSRYEHDESRSVVGAILKEAYREIGREFNFYPSQPVTVILYNERGFFDVTRSPGWAGGLYDGKIRLPIKDIAGREDELKRIIYHEYSHALVRALTPYCPMWLNEGLAEYFSLEDDVEKIGQLIPLNNLEYGFPGDTRAAAVAYRQSYSAVCYLIDKFGLYRVKELLEALAREQDIRKAFDSVLYTAYDRFLETWGKD
jgi:tetratricopeptide (TPR) repeat protein